MARPVTQTQLQQVAPARAQAAPTRKISAAPTASVKVGGLMSALADVQPELNQFLKEQEAEYETNETNRALDAFQGMSFADAQSAVKAGNMRQTESPYFQAAFEKQFGMAYASERRRAIVDAYNNDFDQDNGDLDSFLAQYAESDIETYGDSAHIMSGYREGMNGVFGKIKDQQAAWQSEKTMTQVGDNFVNITRGAIDEAIETGDEIMPIVRRLYDDHKSMLGLSYGEMDDYVMQVASEYAAAGDLATVEALMNYDPTGTDGTKIGAFSKRAKYAEKATQLVETAKANQGVALREANTNTMVEYKVLAGAGDLREEDKKSLQAMKDSKQITQVQHESILQTNALNISKRAAKDFEASKKIEIGNAALDTILAGEAWTIMDQQFVNEVDGSVVEIDADDLIKANVTDYMKALETKGSTPPVMATQLASLGVDYKYPKWENAMSAGHYAITEALAKAGTTGEVELPERATVGYDLWKGLGDNPAVRNNHVGKEAEDVYRDAYALERIGWEPEEALLRSAAIDRKSRRGLSSSVERERFNNATRNIAVKKGILGIGRERAANEQAVLGWVEDSVRIQMDLSVPMETAIENAVEAYEESHTLINGSSINTRDIYVPSNMDEVSTTLLKTFASETGEDWQDLTLRPSHDGSNFWIVSYKGNVALPADPTDGVPNRFHISQIQQASRDAYDLEREQVVTSMDDVNATVQSRSDFIEEQEENPVKGTRIRTAPPASANPLLAPIK